MNIYKSLNDARLNFEWNIIWSWKIRRCGITNELIWLESAMRGIGYDRMTFIYNSRFPVKVEEVWVTKKAYFIANLKGDI